MRNVITDELIAFKRAVIESAYSATVDVYASTNEYKSGSSFKKAIEKQILKDEPCRVSTQTTRITSESPREAYKRVTIILAPEHEIPAGARFEVVYNGTRECFNHASDFKMFSDHQTITLLMYDDERDIYA